MTRLTGITMALALTLSFVGSVRAQYKATGEDGITASPKTRQLLDEYNKNHSPAATPVEAAKMGCDSCKDSVTSRTDYTARGANKPVVLVATHLCKSCGTEWKTTGVGKAQKAVAVHTCENCSVASAN